MKFLRFLLLGICAMRLDAQSQPRVEVGQIGGASFRIDIPTDWNGDLAIYCHGYSDKPVQYKRSALSPRLGSIEDRHVAIAQAGLSTGSWSMTTSLKDVEALRKYFTAHYGKPKHVFIIGESFGGYLAMALLEESPTKYDGGVVYCAPLVPPAWFMGRRVFDLRAVFDVYFPGVFGRLDARASPAEPLPRSSDIEQLLSRNPAAAENLRKYAGAHSDKDLAQTVVFFTSLLSQLQQNAGGNPFSNVGILYEGTDADGELNEKIIRYIADPQAATFVRKLPQPTGRLRRRLISIETTYDPLIPVWAANFYQSLAQQVQPNDLFEERYVEGTGHCAIPNSAISDAFISLEQRAGSTVGTDQR